MFTCSLIITLLFFTVTLTFQIILFSIALEKNQQVYHLIFLASNQPPPIFQNSDPLNIVFSTTPTCPKREKYFERTGTFLPDETKCRSWHYLWKIAIFVVLPKLSATFKC